MKRNGVILLLTLVISVVLFILAGAYFSGLLTEKRAADTERFVLQALNLAEAGANHSYSELRLRIRTDLQDRVNDEASSSVFRAYVTGNDSLGFLRDFAYADGEAQFTVAGSQATLNVINQPLVSVPGNYDAQIIVTENAPPSNPQTDTYIFSYNYTLAGTGNVTSTSPLTQRRVSLEQGAFTITVRRDTFARYALFSNHHRMPSGTTVWFTGNTNFTGPLHTNERFSFANNPSGHFTDAVTQHLTTARFYNNGFPRLLDADSNPPRDVPQFDASFSRGVAEINLPSLVTQQDLKTQATGGQNDGPWASGIYLPNQDGSLVGGVYIKGNASNVTMSVDLNNRPVYTITQGTNTKTITVDYATNSTIVANVSGSGGTPAGTYVGIPNGISNEGLIIYGNGSINNFSGTVQSDTTLTVSSDTDIIINNHVMYQDFNPGPPPSAEDHTNVLGILTWNGNVRIGTTAPNNINIHGVVMATGRNGIFTVDQYYNTALGVRGTATLLGGAITDFYGPFGTFSGSTPISGYGRNFVYDTRMLQGVSPPYFPYMANFTSFDDGGLDQKLPWQDKGV